VYLVPPQHTYLSASGHIEQQLMLLPYNSAIGLLLEYVCSSQNRIKEQEA
jgi:hypothetical protein